MHMHMHMYDEFSTLRYENPVLRTHLSTNGVEHELRRLLSNLSQSVKYLREEVSRHDRGNIGCSNIYGEEQSSLDVFSDSVILSRLRLETSFGVCQFASEEQDNLVSVKPNKGVYSVTVDPLDGSSVADVNLSVGSIFGVHKGRLLGLGSGRNSLVAAMYVIYGPRATLVYTVGNGVHEFVLDSAGNWVLSRSDIKIGDKGTIYSMGGLRREWTDEHLDFVEYLEKQGYKQRYSGCFVADVNQIILKGGGIFSYPSLKSKKKGKLRLLMELQPLAFMTEVAGGKATDGSVPILDKIPKRLDERSPVYIGSKEEVDLFGFRSDKEEDRST